MTDAISNPTKMLIMAGGTGGHVFPALALATVMQERGWIVEWLGTAKGIEANVVVAAGIKLHCLKITGVRGKSVIDLVKAPFKILFSIWAAKQVLRQFKPHVVVGLGGYASGPGGIAAFFCRIPLAIHEQNAIAGTTNKILSFIASAVLTGFPEVLKNGLFIGNPVRKELLHLSEPHLRMSVSKKNLNILVLGGSLGALALNKIVPQGLSLLDAETFNVCHQTGEKHIERTKTFYQQCEVKADIRAFIDDMAERLSWADLVICRSGALTVAELSSVGVAAILVPFPFAIDDHQTENARWLERAGGALVCPQSEFSAQYLKEKIECFISHKQVLIDMAQAARVVAKPEATEGFAKVCEELAYV